MIEVGLPKFSGLALSGTRKARLLERLTDGLATTAESIADDVRDAAPVDKGSLRDSVRVETNARRGRVAILAGGTPETKRAGDNDFDEAVETEYGTTKSAPDPFFYPTIERREAEFGEVAIETGRSALDGDD